MPIRMVALTLKAVQSCPTYSAGRTLGVVQVVHVLHHNQYSLDLYISLELKSLIALVLDGFGA